MAAVAMSSTGDADIQIKMEEEKPTLTPPASVEADKNDDSGSELSDLEGDGEDTSEILPDHYYEGGRIPVFKPTMEQFRSFKSFVQKIDKYGMKSGIVKIIPPKEWRDSLPPLDDQVKTIKVKNPITQEFHGTHGTYTQANIEKMRSYNLPQWKAVSEESNHQPPARRGERRRNQELRVTRGSAPRAAKKAVDEPKEHKKRGVGRPRVRPLPATVHAHEEDADEGEDFKVQVPPTPTSPVTKPAKLKKEADREASPSKPKGRQPRSDQPKSVSSRRKHNSRDQTDVIDEEAFKEFDYRIHNQDEYTAERCQELEVAYWKSLTFNNPMYGADMPGSLFDDTTESWNVAKLENILDVLGQKVPGVNTTYLYLGMWKATFSWHLEDVDLYSINYIHFGAPKQWYSISQEDARRFEAAMRTIWPNDAKNCDQFLRHKTYLISPQLLKSQFNIEVNRLVHYEGEFVITFPYGYHSGYNIGYNCAESVNFATESWLDYGRIAKKCNCEADSVWIDVADIERKLRGEATPEYFEETDDEEDEEDEEEEEEGPTDLPTPPGSDKGKPKVRSHKRKRDPNEKEAKPKVKRLRIKISAPAKEPCCLCPNDPPFEPLLPTDNGKQAHRRCGLYTPETYIAEENGTETICDISRIDKARLELKCIYCRNKRGSVFQCSSKKCIRAYHATCAAPAGVQVDIGIVPVFGEDGTEYTDTGIDFRCRFHRVRRPKLTDVDATIPGIVALEESSLIRKYASKLPRGEVVQVQYLQGDIFAGVVLENRRSEQMLLIEVLPKGDTVEVEYKWLLVFDPANSLLPIPSENAKPLPVHLVRKSQTTTEDPLNDAPKTDDPFCDPNGLYKWAEFHTVKLPRNPAQVKINFLKPRTLWYYLGKTSTEAKAQYTGDPKKKFNDLAANFLESVKPVVTAIPTPLRRSYPASYPTGVNQNAHNAARVTYAQQQAALPQQIRPQPKPNERPYTGKYAIKEPLPSYMTFGNHNHNQNHVGVDHQALRNQQAFLQKSSTYPPNLYIRPGSYQAPPAPMRPIAPMLPVIGDPLRRLSNPQINAEDYRRYAHSNNQQLHHQNQRSPSLPLPLQQPQTQAPVANMMGTPSPIRRDSNSISRPSSSHQPTTSLHDLDAQARSRSTSVTVLAKNPTLAKYPFLMEAAMKRPAVYQSPYAPGGGFTEAWLPHPNAPKPKHIRNVSISQDFLMKRTPSQQEVLKTKTHIRQVSADKALLQHKQHVEQQKRQQELKQHVNMPPPMSLSLDTSTHTMHPSLVHTQPFQPHPFTPQSFGPHTLADFQSSFTPSHSAYPGLLHQNHDSFHANHNHTYPPPGLQFQSPRDFQLQMQREMRRGSKGGGLGAGGLGGGGMGNGGLGTSSRYEDFLRGMAMHEGEGRHPHSHGGQDDGGDTAGSPLRQGMRGGGEMLPMMRDQY